MRVSIFLLFFCSISIIVSAQSTAQQFLLSSKRKNIEKQHFITAQTYIPISLGSVLGGGKINFPPTVLQYNYGVFQNISLGALLGYSSTSSKNITSAGGYDLLNALQKIICDTDPATATSLGLSCNKTGSDVTIKTNYVLLGLSGKYFIEASDMLDVYGNISAGYKAGSKQNVGTVNIDPSIDGQVNQIIGAYNTASKFFVVTSIGAHIYVSKPKTFAITLEGGYGYGLGDDIIIGTKAIVLSIGATYHIDGKN
jgi:hypothetical protein